MARAPKLTKDPNVGGGGGTPPELKPGQRFDDIGSYGLRAFSGYVREEYLPQLSGRQEQGVYREMLDNSSTVGAIMFAITQAMRKVTWRIEPAQSDGYVGKASADKVKPGAQQAADFVSSLMEDMGHTWDDFVAESLSMLGYGFSIHEIVYKRRLGKRNDSHTILDSRASSKFDDGKIGWRRLPARGQDTIWKWFFDINGGIRGVTQQPYTGSQVSIPIEKFLLFRAANLKNNPQGRSILRNAYRPYYFIKRLEELEAISVERMNGFPVLSVPSEMIDRALSVTAAGAPADQQAAQAYAQYKKIVTNIRVDEQMGLILPSDIWQTSDGKPSSQRMYQMEFLTPQHGAGAKAGTGEIIARYKIDILMTVLADFIQMGHEVRGTNNLAVTKVDMFYQTIEAWLNNHAAVLNRFALPRLWALNGDDEALMPQFKPDMAQRLDLDSLGQYVANLFAAGLIAPDDPLREFLREAGGMPEETDEAKKAAADMLKLALTPKAPVEVKGGKSKTKASANA